MARHDVRHAPTGRYMPAEAKALTGAPAHSPMHALGDDGHRGHVMSDHVILENAHPHTMHSVGYQVGHVVHDPRGKGPEHHGPHGLMDHDVHQSNKDQTVF